MKTLRALPLALLCLLSLDRAVALAQGSGKPSKEDRAEARRLFDEAERHYKLQEYQEALDRYKDAYRLSNLPELLFDIGQCYRQLGRYEEAIRSYQWFLRDDPKT